MENWALYDAERQSQKIANLFTAQTAMNSLMILDEWI
jgi:hypothetical protein